jgi:hypothetical protein
LNTTPVTQTAATNEQHESEQDDHFATSAALVEMFFLRFAQFVKVSGIHLKKMQESLMTSLPDRSSSGNQKRF